MKLTKQLFGIALTVIASSAFVACTNELKESDFNKNNALGGLSLVKAPEVYAWSGSQTLNNTRSDIYTVPSVGTYSFQTRAEEEIPVTITPCTVSKDVWDYEAAAQYADDKLPEGNVNIEELEDVDFDFVFFAKDGDMEFEIYPVLCNTNRNPQTIGIFYFDKEDQLKTINFTTDFNPYTVRQSEPLPGYRITVKQGYKFGFYWGCVYQIYDDSNQYYPYKDRNNIQYTSSNMNEEAYVKSNGEATGEFQQIRAGIFYQYTNDEQTEGITYIGTEDWDDFDFQDIVFACNEIIHSVSQDNTEWGKDDGDTPTPPTPPSEKCPNCPHEKHEGDCSHEDCESPTCNPCPNVENGVGCTHSKAQHHWDDEKNQWICDNEECEAEDCHHSNSTEPEDPCNKCPHEKHEGKNCENPNCDVPDCNPCPNKDKESGEGGCDHSGAEHRKVGDKWVCIDPDCTAEDCKSSTVVEDKDLVDGGNEVEINLSINDYNNQGDIANLISKLSIHVRYDHDVKVTIPMAYKYYVDQDDLMILNKHEDGLYEYGGSADAETHEPLRSHSHSLSYTIGNLGDVILTVAYEIPENSEEGYITVTTSGITKDIMDYCKKMYGDGLNFEIYNYFNYRKWNETTKEYDRIEGNNITGLKDYLDRATVEFVYDNGRRLPEDLCPNYYINAFGNRGAYNGKESERPADGYDPSVNSDCTVSIVSSQSEYYDDGKEGWHLNNQNSNVIYKNKSVTDNSNEKNEHSHGFLWDPYLNRIKNGSNPGSN